MHHWLHQIQELDESTVVATLLKLLARTLGNAAVDDLINAISTASVSKQQRT
ncbi:hypothetical protein RISK_002505 [Rhodopirellula islandica]|uniref:Mobile element protein n=1 Tax=Rhodopirellula islandica TaxID=595434 RepID=A0A0J1BH35_RHOIS|nr:hypothetical protein RISK_002505 [Rhodopirellula islandica]